MNNKETNVDTSDLSPTQLLMRHDVLHHLFKYAVENKERREQFEAEHRDLYEMFVDLGDIQHPLLPTNDLDSSLSMESKEKHLKEEGWVEEVFKKAISQFGEFHVYNLSSILKHITGKSLLLLEGSIYAGTLLKSSYNITILDRNEFIVKHLTSRALQAFTCDFNKGLPYKEAIYDSVVGFINPLNITNTKEFLGECELSAKKSVIFLFEKEKTLLSQKQLKKAFNGYTLEFIPETDCYLVYKEKVKDKDPKKVKNPEMIIFESLLEEV